MEMNTKVSSLMDRLSWHSLLLASGIALIEIITFLYFKALSAKAEVHTSEWEIIALGASVFFIFFFVFLEGKMSRIERKIYLVKKIEGMVKDAEKGAVAVSREKLEYGGKVYFIPDLSIKSKKIRNDLNKALEEETKLVVKSKFWPLYRFCKRL